MRGLSAQSADSGAGAGRADSGAELARRAERGAGIRAALASWDSRPCFDERIEPVSSPHCAAICADSSARKEVSLVWSSTCLPCYASAMAPAV